MTTKVDNTKLMHVQMMSLMTKAEMEEQIDIRNGMLRRMKTSPLTAEENRHASTSALWSASWPGMKNVGLHALTKYNIRLSYLGNSVSENLVPRFSCLAQLGTANLVNSGRNRTISLAHGSSKSCLGGVPTNQSLSEEKGTESDLHMHPLLFQAHEDAGFPYLQTGASRNFNFLPGTGSQLQVSFNHMYKLHDATYMVHNFDKMLDSRSTSAFEFHPLLQMVDHANNDAVASVYMSADSELFPGSSTPLTAYAMSDPQINSNVLQEPTELANSCETASDVDLEIHLCSRSRKEEALRNIETVKPFIKFKNPCHNDDALILSGNTTGGYMIDAMNDHSLPEMLMEQEELSDSEEECGDHVEFECEEMADSEGEELSGEQLVTLRNKVESSEDEDKDENEDEKDGVLGGGTSRLFVGNLPFTMSPSQIKEVFAEAGRVASVEVELSSLPTYSTLLYSTLL
ncbi:hypothetical protein Sjap_008603 [Stephania japonica]|uniref:RRM domain-containing protein n=1 Tax=Stephania japonica TaxID=461633 RepID=A0AAP0PCH8_9MAGN